jgi:hypothetical protein
MGDIYLDDSPSRSITGEEKGHSKLLEIHQLLKSLEDISKKNESLSYKIKLGLFGPDPKAKPEGEQPEKTEQLSIPNTLDGAFRRLNIIHGSLIVNRNTLERILKEL